MKDQGQVTAGQVIPQPSGCSTDQADGGVERTPDNSLSTRSSSLVSEGRLITSAAVKWMEPYRPVSSLERCSPVSDVTRGHVSICDQKVGKAHAQ
jgi:hypothetical protein